MKKEEFLSLTLTQLAKKTNINKGTLSKYFSPNNPETPTWKNIEKMALSLNTSAENIMKYIKAKRYQNYEILKNKVSDAKQSLLETA